ncbi:methyl-accepting chemotaxis protein [Mangrovitalea sediminis]|uniref:methyl-accepting chemotaxis protein n=1 Tax=Mangrovitalea sediminis TaxID=1982043 RepID=UPI0013046B78|nr:HAMP domain-containing methyl-accepting chemotaxis protein [Mangrovitalea sediminis]
MFRITFKQKLSAVVVLSLMGIGYLAYVAFASLYELDSTSKRVASLTALGDTLSSAQLALLTAENRIPHLQAGEVTSYKQSLGKLRQRYSERFSEAAGHIENTDLKDRLTNVNHLFEAYQEALLKALAVRQALGFDDQSGALKTLKQSEQAIEKQLSPFNMLWQPFIVVQQLTSRFLVDPSESAAKNLKTQLSTAIAKVKDAGFYDSSKSQIDGYQSAVDGVVDAALKVGQQAVVVKQADAQFIEQSQQTDRFLKENLLVKARVEADQATTQARWTLGLVSGGVALGIALILAATGLGAAGSLRRIMQQVSAVAEGDLRKRLVTEPARKDEFDQVSSAVDTMTDDLHKVISEVVGDQGALNDQVSELTSAVQVIADNNGSVSEQSTSLAGATEEISATTSEVANSIRSLRDDTESAHHAAIEGERTISEAMRSLTETAGVMEASAQQLMQLEQYSQEIDKVMSMINDLAEQTNLLALNAAIEAARAGEQGRGFAVVADEVRTLAERTGSATGEITRAVRAIQEQTQSVVSIMNQSRSSIDVVQQQGREAQTAVTRIQAQTEKASSTCAEITSAIEETARTTREMAANMDHIAHSIERNSDAIKAIVDSSDSLQKRAEAMGRMTAKFKLR